MSKFDLIIANPPFEVASELIQTIIPYAEQHCILAPYMKYRKYELYKYVEKSEIADKSLFIGKSQDIQPNLLICKLNNKRIESRKLIDMEIPLWNQTYIQYYLQNLKRPQTFESRIYNSADREFVESNLDCILFVPYWPHVGNCMKEKSVTRKANTGEKESLKRILKSNRSYAYFIFKTKRERENAYRFWITDLNNQLILGCLTRSLAEKFPHVDWSEDQTNLIKSLN